MDQNGGAMVAACESNSSHCPAHLDLEGSYPLPLAQLRRNRATPAIITIPATIPKGIATLLLPPVVRLTPPLLLWDKGADRTSLSIPAASYTGVVGGGKPPAAGERDPLGPSDSSSQSYVVDNCWT